VTHGQCVTRPTITFSASEHHRPLASTNRRKHTDRQFSIADHLILPDTRHEYLPHLKEAGWKSEVHHHHHHRVARPWQDMAVSMSNQKLPVSI